MLAQILMIETLKINDVQVEDNILGVMEFAMTPATLYVNRPIAIVL